jgi:hypothetical protein
MRRLYRVDDDTPFAWATNRDFYRVADDTLWAHESHQWLIAAGSGRMLAHRVGTRYYDADTGQPLYYEMVETASRPRRAAAVAASDGAAPAEALKIVRGRTRAHLTPALRAPRA